MEAARAADLKLLHLCTPPVSAAEVYTAVTGKADWHNELPKPPFDYDLRSCHAALLGGSGDYLCTKQQELMILRALCAVGRTTHAELSACHLEHCMAEGR